MFATNGVILIQQLTSEDLQFLVSRLNLTQIFLSLLTKVFHEDILCQGIFFEWLETLTYLMTKTHQCLSAHESPSDEAN